MTREYPEIYILRHGQTTWNAAGRMQGHQNTPLTELGREQALKQQKALKSAAVGAGHNMYCSPLGRTRETAEIALAGCLNPVQFDDRLMEISAGEAEGLTLADVEAEWPEVLQNRLPFEWIFHCPGGERFNQFCERVQSWLDDLTGPSVVVTHGITSRVMRGLLLGLDINGMEQMPGGQGVVYFVKDGIHRQLEA